MNKKNRKLLTILLLAALLVVLAVLLFAICGKNGEAVGKTPAPLPTAQSEQTAAPAAVSEQPEPSEAAIADDPTVIEDDPVIVDNPADGNPAERSPAVQSPEDDASDGGSGAEDWIYILGENDLPVIEDSDD